jgi:hypothetical protein
MQKANHSTLKDVLVSSQEPAGTSSAIRLESATFRELFSTAAFLGVSAQELAERLLTEALAEPLAASGTVFLGELAMRPYPDRDAAAAVCERLSELAVSESLEGPSQQLLSAEVIQTALGCQIEVEVLDPNNSGGRKSVIPMIRPDC